MRLAWSEQYGCACVVPEEGDTADDVIDVAEENAAMVMNEGYVVELRPDVGPEVWTEEALRRSMR